MAYKSFQESLVWQKSEALLLSLSRELLQTEARWLRDRLMKSALASNQLIAKGYEKNSKKALIQHLKLAKQQLIKVRSILTLAQHMDFMEVEDAQAHYEQALEVTKLVQGLIRHLYQGEAQRA